MSDEKQCERVVVGDHDQNSNSAMLNDGGRLLNTVADQYTAGKNVNNWHPRPVLTPQICLIPSWKMKISFDTRMIFAVAAALPCG